MFLFQGYFHTETHDHLEPKKIESATLTCTFSTAEDNPSITIVVFTQMDQMVGINGKREVIRDFIL